MYKINVIPYIAGAGNQFANEGEWAYELTYFQHPRIGPNNDAYICPAKTFRKRCPICEHRAKLANDPTSSEELIKSLWPKERQLWNVVDLTEPTVVQLWDVSNFCFGMQLDEKIKNADNEEYDYFSDPEEGYWLRLVATEVPAKGFKFIKFSVDEIKPRKEDNEQVTQEHLDAAFILESLIKETEYDDLYRIFHQIQDDDEGSKDEAPPPERDTPRLHKPKREAPPVESPFKVGMMIEHTTFGACEVVKIDPATGKLRLEICDSGKIRNDCNPTDCIESTPTEDANAGTDAGNSTDDSGDSAQPAEPAAEPAAEPDAPVSDGDGFGDPDDEPDAPVAKPKTKPPTQPANSKKQPPPPAKRTGTR